MIRYVKRKHLDLNKYNACIEKATESKIYAFSWYLDIVADHWDVLVLNDYKAVMPIPWREKFFIKYVYQPFFTQQLGVFSIEQNSIDLINEFIRMIPNYFLKVNLQFNHLNNLTYQEAKERVNYILKLNKSYQNLFKNFSKGRKHAINAAKKKNLIVKEVLFINVIKVAKTYYNFNFMSDLEYARLKKLSKKGVVLGVFNRQNKFLGGAVFMKDSKRITYLFSVFTSKGKEEQASSFLIDYIIKQNQNTNYILDFEGSMIKGIASFYKSFGAENEKYKQLIINKLPKIVNRFFSVNI